MGYNEIYQSVLKDYSDILTVEEMSKYKDRIPPAPGQQNRTLEIGQKLSDSEGPSPDIHAGFLDP